MSSVFLVNAAINLIVGVALLMAWRHDREQRFTPYIGSACLAAMAGGLGYLAWRQALPAWHAVGGAALVAAFTLYDLLLALGVSHLAGRPMRGPRVVALASILLLLHLSLLALDEPAAQGINASVQVAIGALALFWLWRFGGAERLSGVLLVLIGLNQYSFLFLGHAGIEWQSGAGTLLRAGLGLALLYAALFRSAADARRMRDRFMQMTDNSHQGVSVVRGEELLYANPAQLRIYGAKSVEDFGASFRNATIPEATRAEVRERHRRLVSGELDRADWEGWRHKLDGTPIRVRFSAWRIDWDGAPAEQVVATDETQVYNATQALLHQATHEQLTGLPNRSALLARLRELCGNGTAHAGFALVLLDIDRFKLFNDAHGHSLGDEVLKALARTLTHKLGGSEPPGTCEVLHLGEDEFALLAPRAGREQAVALAMRVRTLLARPLQLPGGAAFYVDASMGLALHPEHGAEPEALLRAATAALHEAKREAGTSLALAEARFERGSSEALGIEQALRAGLHAKEFSLAFQPKIDARTQRLCGFEALARWNRPSGERALPAQFIATAERTGLIGSLGQLILTQACRQLAEWRQQHGTGVVPVAVNVSPLQLLDADFPQAVARTLREFDLPAQLLALEITESAAVTHMERACAQLLQLREMGIHVALDDFGTGFSSLNLLRSLPLHTVKIDRSLIDPMPASDATAVVRAICTLAEVLRLEVVAEGVEREEQAAAARSAGCHALQGFFYSAPLSALDAGRWLREGRQAA
jgi:diguanylate cyclase (GGDEF)-like protein/PAS domain S-box-containing protein